MTFSDEPGIYIRGEFGVRLEDDMYITRRRRETLHAAIGIAGEAVLTTIREMLENIERDTLVPRAARSAETRGRDREEPEDDLRPSYQRDRDRIIHCKAFRRLKHKTQVFLAPEGDHYRTRLTHVLEVTQIARTIAKSLRLNEVLTEAIGLGHDLGHSAFGHAGEAALNKLVNGGFDHYRQSVRVVEVLENDGRGLNLTIEVRDGILKHSKGEKGELLRTRPKSRALTLEGDIVRISDIIAYVNHDIDDGIRAGILTEDDIPKTIRKTLGNDRQRPHRPHGARRDRLDAGLRLRGDLDVAPRCSARSKSCGRTCSRTCT